MKRIAVLVSGGGTNLQAILDAIREGRITNASVEVAISNNPGAYALERARRAGIPGYVVSRKDYDTNQAMTAALVDKLNRRNPGDRKLKHTAKITRLEQG